jgi:CubicO group peptidase (beta-lactamase class C family)
VPTDWDALILKALEKQPGKRFQSAGLMSQAISNLGEMPASKTEKKVQLWPRLLLTGLLAATLVVALVVVWRLPASTTHASVAVRIRTYLSRLAAQGQLSGTVLVAQKGKILVDQGYGLADQRLHIPNRPNTRYVAAGFTPILSSTGDLQFVESGLPRWSDRICTYVPHCPAVWQPITVRMVLDGTSGLPGYGGFGTTGSTVGQSLAGCQSLPLDGKPGSGTDYQSCNHLVLALIRQKISGLPWAQSGILSYPGMQNSGQMLNTTRAPDRATDYNGSQADPSTTYNDSFTAYSTAPDILAFDNDLFGGRLLAPTNLKRVLAPRVPPLTLDSGVNGERWGYDWKVGTLFSRRVAYTIDAVNYFQDVNMRFPDAGITIIVLSNNALTNVWDVSVRAAAMVLGKPRTLSQHLAAPPVTLLGTYRRVFRNQDRLAAHDRGLQNFVGAQQTITFKGHVVDYNRGTVDEFYNARASGSLSFLGYTVNNQSGFCSNNRTETPPTGTYRWSKSGNKLIITRVSDSHCPDRASLMPGTWIKT